MFSDQNIFIWCFKPMHFFSENNSGHLHSIVNNFDQCERGLYFCVLRKVEEIDIDKNVNAKKKLRLENKNIKNERSNTII